MQGSMRLLISVCLLLAASFGHTAFQQQSSPVARKLTSYDDKIGSSEAEQWLLEDLVLPELMRDPQSKAYIIGYSAPEDAPGKARRYAARAKNYLISRGGFDPQRIIPVEGGRRKEFGVEVWLVPKDAKPPEPSPNITVPDDLGDNLLYDDFYIGEDSFAGYTEDGHVRLDGFAAALKKEPNSWGCIVAYAQAGNDREGMAWDEPGVALKMAREQKTYLARTLRIPSSKLSVIDGGYAYRKVELWIMRPNARFDRGPFLYPGRLRSNRNGTLTIGAPNENTLQACASKSNSLRIRP